MFSFAIVLSIFNINIATFEPCENDTDSDLPLNWPCHWSDDGVVPFAFNYYSMNLNKFMKYVTEGHRFIEERSCLRFQQYDSREVAKMKNFTYLYYSYSGVLESCCLKFFSKPIGRRLVLITPLCLLPIEAAHTTLHGLGLSHGKHMPFQEEDVRAVMFPYQCKDYDKKLRIFNNLK